jgi:hypothetical protein
MPKKEESWVGSETLWLVGICVAAMTVMGVARQELRVEGWVTLAIAFVAGVVRIVKGKDE